MSTIYRAHYTRKDGKPRYMTFSSAHGHKEALKFAASWALGDTVKQVDALTTEDLPLWPTGAESSVREDQAAAALPVAGGYRQ